MRSTRVIFRMACLVGSAVAAHAQGFGPPQPITSQISGGRGVYATDLDGDGDADVLSASFWDNTIAWYENLGGGVFGPGR